MTTVNMPTACSVKSDVYVSWKVNNNLKLVYKYLKDYLVTQLERLKHKLGQQILESRLNRCITYSWVIYIYLFTYLCLLNSVVRSSYYTALNGRMINEKQLERIWKWLSSNVRYNPSICLQRLRFDIWTRHIQNTSQKHCLNKLPRFLSVKQTHILTCIHKSCIWMACCPDVCNECAH
jgi:hypothetical protein